MTMLESQITNLTVVYSTVYSGVHQRKHQSAASLAFVREIHRGPVNFPHKWPVTRKMFPFDDVIMVCLPLVTQSLRKHWDMWDDHWDVETLISARFTKRAQTEILTFEFHIYLDEICLV